MQMIVEWPFLLVVLLNAYQTIFTFFV